ncbi:hypothetical protein GCM10010193_13310 [Kitasatospora atroaurantiaca]|uniref:Pro-kumamolisin-like protein n=1 Tax=Kitasatospora atroaurantiaca TaxID=285545 RepID=A0A561ESS7_9ACTN|nr:S53 family peptidase [Kitasatospora atroaurantiaca]TWE18665.1 pro-kumamolisin-like protein [Kitasatospora atroaurantiaca]
MLDPLGPTRTPRIRGSLGRATTLVVATAALVAGAGLPTVMTAQAATLSPQRVGGVPNVPGSAVKVADPAGDTPLDLSIHLRSRDLEGAKQLADAVSDSTSPQYRQYLRTGEFAQRFGADAATVAKVTQALKDQGLTPGALGADGLTIPVHTTVAAAKKAFDTSFAGYKLADGSTGYLNTTAPALRGDVAGSVVSVVGLNGLARAHSNHIKGKGVQVTPQAKGAVGSRAEAAYPQLCQSTKDQLNTRWGVTEGTDYFSASSLASVYGLNNLSDGGAGTTVAIFALEDYSDAAVNTFQSCYGTSASVKRVKVDAGTQATPNNNDVGVESALDIDTIVGLAPKSDVLVYQGPDYTTATDQQVQATYQKIVNDNVAQVISSSWGVCDQVVAGSDLSAEHDIFLQAALQGQSVVAASGDYGSSSCHNLGIENPNRLSADDPSGQPYVTGVGGTTLTGVANPSEKVWNHGGGASGGGITRWQLSDSYNFQAGFTGPGFTNSFCSAPSGRTCRQSPDVAAVADPATGYVIATGDNYWTIMGGTSGAAPLWAAVAAHANSSGKCSGRVGLLNHPLYQAARAGQSPLRDITSGNNDIGYHGGLYAAAAGYDMATGLGTPKAAQVIDKVCLPSATFKPLAPSRILDTRSGAIVGPKGEVALQVSGQAGVPASGVSAVVLNVTVTDTTAWGYLTAYPHGAARPLSSNINWTAKQTIPNLVTVPLGADGKVSLFNGGPGNVNFVADVQGYYSTTEAGSQLKPINPTRLLDTRDSSKQANLAGKGEVALQVGGQAGVPASGVSAAVLNVTITDTVGPGYLTAYPSGTTRPLASNLNWSAGQTIPNAVIVPVGADGKVNLYNGSPWGSNVVVDIAGYFSDSVTGGKFHTAGPMRQVDTRTDLKAPLANGQVLNLEMTENNWRVPKEATSVVLNVTVTDTTGSGYLTVWPYGQTRPTASNLNWTAGTTIANLVTVPVVDGKVSLAAFGNGTTQVVADLFGYYSN